MSVTYSWWGEVPAGLVTASQLGELDLPRTAAGRQPDAWVRGHDWRGKRTDLALYRVTDCPPTRSSAARLASTSDRPVCADCGARPDRPVRESLPDGVRRCSACRHIRRLRAQQTSAAEQRGRIVSAARRLLATDQALAMVADRHTPPRTASGRVRPPTAVRLMVAELASLKPRARLTVRLVGPRAHHVPNDAIDQANAVRRLAWMRGRPIVCWNSDDAAAARQALGDLISRAGAYGRHLIDPEPPLRPTPIEGMAWVELAWAATVWRGAVEVRNGHLTPALHPGTADRLALLIHRIAATDTPDQTETRLTTVDGGLTMPNVANPYVYFVSYRWFNPGSDGAGNTAFATSTPITGLDHIRHVEARVMQECGFETVVITNFALLQGPEVPRVPGTERLTAPAAPVGAPRP